MDISNIMTEVWKPLGDLIKIAKDLPPLLRFLAIVYIGALILWVICLPFFSPRMDQFLLLAFIFLFLVFGLVLVFAAISSSKHKPTPAPHKIPDPQEAFLLDMLRAADSKGNYGVTLDEWKEEMNCGAENNANFEQTLNKLDSMRYVVFYDAGDCYRLTPEGRKHLRANHQIASLAELKKGKTHGNERIAPTA